MCGGVASSFACASGFYASDESCYPDLNHARFSKIAPEKAEVVKLRYFAGMTIPEVAEALGIAHATAERYWAYARVWLYNELNETDEDAIN